MPGARSLNQMRRAETGYVVTMVTGTERCQHSDPAIPCLH